MSIDRGTALLCDEDEPCSQCAASCMRVGSCPSRADAMKKLSPAGARGCDITRCRRRAIRRSSPTIICTPGAKSLRVSGVSPHTFTRAVWFRGDRRHLAVPRGDGAHRRAVPRLRRSGDGRDAGRSDRLGRSSRDRGASQLRLRPVTGPAAVPLNGHESLPVGRACPSLAGFPGACRGRFHRSRRARRLLRHRDAPAHARRRLPVDLVPSPRGGARAYLERLGRSTPFWLGTPDAVPSDKGGDHGRA